jgi:hypothetical protein
MNSDDVIIIKQRMGNHFVMTQTLTWLVTLAFLIIAKSIVSMKLVHKIDVQSHVGNNNSRIVNQVISWSNAYMH